MTGDAKMSKTAYCVSDKDFAKRVKKSKRKKAKVATRKQKKFKELQRNRRLKHFQVKLLNNPTPAEKEFQKILDGLGVEYVCQKKFVHKGKSYFVDFWLPTYKTIIEIDGEYHETDSQKKKDKTRTCHLIKKNHVGQLIRMTNQEVLSKDAANVFAKRLCPFLSLLKN